MQPSAQQFSEEDGMSDLMAEGEEDLGTEGFEADGFEQNALEGFEAEGLEEGDGFEAEGFEEDGFEQPGANAFEGEGFEADGFEQPGGGANAFEAEGFEGEEAHALEDAFLEALDAEDEDEFLRRLGGALRRTLQVATPTLRRIARRAVPVGMRLLRQAAPQLGAIAGQEIGRSVAGLLRADDLDAFADAAADLASDEDLEAFTTVLGGMAARHVVRNTVPPGRRRQMSPQVRALGRQVARATREVAQRISDRYGPGALRVASRVVQQVTRLVRNQGASPRAVPRMIRRAGARVAGSPQAVRRLSRSTPQARRLRARAGLPPRRGAHARPGGSYGGMGAVRTVVLRAPVRIVVRR